MSCETCKHWSEKSTNEWDKDDVHRECNRIKMHDEYVTKRYRDEVLAKPHNPHMSDEWQKQCRERVQTTELLEDQQAYVVDGSSYYAGLFTRVDFSCSLYEAA